MNPIEWLFKNLWILPILYFAFSILKAIFAAKEASKQQDNRPNPLEEQRREREVQEQIRRRIAERRAAQNAPAPAELPPLRQDAPAPSNEAPPPVHDSLGPLGRRVLTELERRLQPKSETSPTTYYAPTQASRAEAERQEQLAEQLRVIEEAKRFNARRAAHAAADRSEVLNSESAQRAAARQELLADLADPKALRRAFVLREVLGPPVALR